MRLIEKLFGSHQFPRKPLRNKIACAMLPHVMIILLVLCQSVMVFSQAGNTNLLKEKKILNKDGIQVRIDQPYSQRYPDMKVYVSVVNKNNEPLLSLVRGNFSVLVDGRGIGSKVDVAGFQYTEEGISYVLLIAGNGLMEGEPLEAQKQAAVNLSEYLREQDYLSVYIYADEVKPVFEFQKKNESLVQQINKIDVMGKSPHFYDVLVFAARRLDQAPTTRKVIIIMSDGRDTDSRFTEKQLFDVLDEKNIPVYGIGIKLMAGQNLFRVADASRRSGGGYIFAPTLNMIPNSMRVLYNQISLGYLLKFEVDTVEPDNKLHQLQIKVNDKGSEANFFKNFIAVKRPIPLWVIIVLIVIAIIIIIVIIILIILRLRKVRKQMGVTKRKCPECKRRLKDDWDECHFCKYHPPKKKKSILQRLFNK